MDVGEIVDNAYRFDRKTRRPPLNGLAVVAVREMRYTGVP